MDLWLIQNPHDMLLYLLQPRALVPTQQASYACECVLPHDSVHFHLLLLLVQRNLVLLQQSRQSFEQQRSAARAGKLLLLDVHVKSPSCSLAAGLHVKIQRVSSAPMWLRDSRAGRAVSSSRNSAVAQSCPAFEPPQDP